jgi:hypothetical protein
MRPWLGTILLLLFGVVLALGLCEIGLRLAGIEYPHFYAFEPVAGIGLRPGVKGYWLKEGGGYVSVNREGWRDREHALAKPPNTLRIAVLGDSFAEAMQVNQDEGFCEVMEKALQGCGDLRGRQVEVLNFGIAGFGTAQELLTLKHRVWQYAPDIVLLAFTSGNDLADNSPVLNRKDSVPFFVLKDGRPVLDDSRTRQAEKVWRAIEAKRNWLGRFYIWRHDHVRVLQVLDYAQEVLRDWWMAKVTGEATGGVKQGAVGAGMFVDIYHAPRDQVWKDAWQVTEALLLKIRDEVVQKGARFGVVVMSNDIQVNPDKAIGKKLAGNPGVEDVFYPDHRVERLCQSHGIAVLLLAPGFQKYAYRDHIFLHGFKTSFRNTLGSGHWNRDGHRLAGETIARWLCPQIN